MHSCLLTRHRLNYSNIHSRPLRGFCRPDTPRLGALWEAKQHSPLPCGDDGLRRDLSENLCSLHSVCACAPSRLTQGRGRGQLHLSLLQVAFSSSEQPTPCLMLESRMLNIKFHETGGMYANSGLLKCIYVHTYRCIDVNLYTCEDGYTYIRLFPSSVC